MGVCALISTRPARSRHPPVPLPHPGEAATATFPGMSSIPDLATGRAHVPVLVRAVGTPPSRGCHTSPHNTTQCQCQRWAWPGSRSARNNPAFERIQGWRTRRPPAEWAHSGGRCREGPWAPAGPQL